MQSNLECFFNTREIAVAIWLFVVLVWGMTKGHVRQSMKALAVQFFHYRILISYLLAVGYSAGGVYLFSRLNIWTSAQLKDTILWCIFIIIGTMMEINKVNENKNYFKDSLKENLKLSILIEFIIGVYTFSLLTELILIPITTLITGMQIFSGKDQKYRSLQKFLSSLMFLLGLFVLGYTIYEITLHIRKFASFDTLRDFILSPLLALWFLPFIYIMSLYMTYESYFIAMQFRIKDRKLLTFSKWQALFRFNTNTSGFERWKNRLFIGSIETKEDVIHSIEEIKRLQRVEKNPPVVNSNLGWSPYRAKEFLTKTGISTGYYHNDYEDSWAASSNVVRLDDNFMGNTVTYYIEGKETVVKKLHLTLSIHDPSKTQEATNKFIQYTKDLYMAAIGNQLPESFRMAIFLKKEIETHIDNINLLIHKNDWINQNGYSYSFCIEHN